MLRKGTLRSYGYLPHPVRHCRPLSSHADLSHWPTSADFSPYEVLNLPPSGPYTKSRYFELVKLYHPDRSCNHPACRHLSAHDRAHRYRLIVAAHEILSDPIKRVEYDRHGLGWHTRTELFGHQAEANWRRRRPRPDISIYRNATWEDWQEYYARRDGMETETPTVPHSTFVSFIAILALIIGITQAVTIGAFSTSYEERMRDANDKNTRFLEERRRETLFQANTPAARVHNFLIKRDPGGHGLKEEEQDTYRSVLGSGSKDLRYSLVDIENAEREAK